jgi:hypothetical protein
MKKIFVSLMMVCLMALPTMQAQTQTYYKQIHPNEISASYGVSLLGTGIGTVVNKLDDLRRWLDIDDGLVVKSGGTFGVINLGYTYQLNKVVSIGGAIGLNSMKIRLEDNTGKIDAARANIWMLMSSAKFDWFRTRSDVFGMYSKVNLGVMGIGASLMEEAHKTLWLPTGHLSLIGLEVGKGFSGFMELGVGMQGIVQAGVRARF